MKKVIIANWKMNLSIAKSLDYVKHLKKSQNEVVIAAPYTFLCELAKKADKKKIKLAAQDVAQFSQGAYTGEVSAQMLKKIGCTYCLVGHSERRIYFKETDEQINQKIMRLLENKIKPVLCLGETAAQRNKKMTKEVIKSQLGKALKNIKNPEGMLVAYEPVWAISTFQKSKKPQAAEISDIVEAHLYIKKVLKSLLKNKVKKIRVIYGGTVNPANAGTILKLKEVDGALVGGASLKSSSFNAIMQATN